MSEAKRFPNGCVASPHYLASSAGLRTLAAGGNAVDAAVATSLMLGVVSPYMCGYGGDLFAIVYDGALHAYNGSGRSPSGATPQLIREASGMDTMPARGPHPVTVPGGVDGWFSLLDRFGTRSFADLARAPLEYARDGFNLTARGAAAMKGAMGVFTGAEFEAWRAIYSHAQPGSKFAQPSLARTIQTLIDRGPDAYYKGEIGESIAGTLQSHGGLMTTDDIANHHGDWVKPLSIDYRGTEILEMPPNTQGIALLEGMKIFEGLTAQGAGNSERDHLLLESMKLAIADRNAYVTDPDQMKIDPAQLGSEQWCSQRRALVSDQAGKPQPHRPADGGTIYLCAADSNGMCVSLIQSNYMGYGSGLTVADWGINLQNRGAFFSLDESHANVIAPSKRTLHTLIPAIAMRDSKPWLVFGNMGGDSQAQFHSQILTRIIDDELDPQQAIDLPRWTFSSRDWSVAAEAPFGEHWAEALRAKGHTVNLARPGAAFGHAHAIQITPDGYVAATDPRAEGAALGL